METEWLGYELGLLSLAALCSVVLSAAEVVIFSLSRAAVDRLAVVNPRTGRWLQRLLGNPHHLKATFRVGRLLSNVAFVASLTLLTFHLATVVGIPFIAAILLEILFIVVAVLFLGIVSPTLYVARRADALAPRAVPFVAFVHFLLTPLTFVFVRLTQWITRRRGNREGLPPFMEEELRTLIEVGEEKGPLEDEERRMIHSIFEFGETLVREVMVPRTDMVTVERNTPVEELVNLIRERGHSRIPVYEGRVDRIIGIVHVKDLLIRLGAEERITDLGEIVRPPYFVPETKKIDELLREFQRERIHMAIVVDEYGGTAGLVTLEDLLEEIVGEIQDEYDFEVPLYRRIDEHTLVVDAKIDLHDLNELLEIELPTEEGYESLGGFILNLTGYVPAEKDVVRYNGYEFVIEKVDRNRILQVRIRRLPQAKTDEVDPRDDRGSSDTQAPFSS